MAFILSGLLLTDCQQAETLILLQDGKVCD